MKESLDKRAEVLQFLYSNYSENNFQNNVNLLKKEIEIYILVKYILVLLQKKEKKQEKVIMIIIIITMRIIIIRITMRIIIQKIK